MADFVQFGKNIVAVTKACAGNCSREDMAVYLVAQQNLIQNQVIEARVKGAAAKSGGQGQGGSSGGASSAGASSSAKGAMARLRAMTQGR